MHLTGQPASHPPLHSPPHRRVARPTGRTWLVLGLVLGCSGSVFAQGGPPPPPPLPPVPVPVENPLTPQKVLLGKFLFWEEQLSADNSVACGTCHMPEAGGSDPRSFAAESVHPGIDGVLGNANDLRGSPGIVLQDALGNLLSDATFGLARQVTARKSPSFLVAGYAQTLFWDGRASGTFVDPESGLIAIATGAALESQSLGPILSLIEMGHTGRDWEAVRSRLQTVVPLALATELPGDLQQALGQFPNYPALFTNAFGTPEIDARRIAFALASYQRALVPNQTPYDQFAAGVPGALTQQQLAGFQVFVQNCLPCHGGGMFSDGLFHNLGVRPIAEDPGRQGVTGLAIHAGQFKTPTLRNVKLRAPFFHNGGKATLAEVIDFYNQGGEFFANQSPLIQPLGLTPQQRNNLRLFLEQALTDPRVEQALPPFDHPRLQPYFRRGDVNLSGSVDLADVVFSLEFLFGGTVDPACLDALDANDDGALNISDPITLLARLFAAAPSLPAPSDLTIGPDPTADALGCER